MTSPDQLRAIPDPAERTLAARAALTSLEADRDAIVAVIREGVRAMRQTMSLGQVAETLGVTRTRVQQLEDKPKEKAK